MVSLGQQLTARSRFGLISLLVINLMFLTTLSPALAEAPELTQNSPAITILPINKAKMIAGSRFDFRVEVNGAKPDSIDILINGQPAAQVFQGVKEERTNASDKSGEVTYRNVSLNVAGSTTVEVKAKAGGQDLSKKVSWEVLKLGQGRAKNVILFIGDGMSFPIITASRIVSRGLTEGRYNKWLEIDRMQYRGAVTTSGYDSLVTDSANSASAYATGHKSVVNAMGVYEDNTKDAFDDPKVENLLELVKRTRNMGTGLVTTADITDATPAAFAAHTRRRGESAFIASTYFNSAHQPDVLMGGGSKWFLPKAQQGSSLDDKDLVAQAKNQGYNIATSKTELKAVPSSAQKILGLYHTGTMNVYMDREVLKGANVLGNFKDQPGLVDMTDAAINTLSKNPNGFFLMVEGASVDKQLHTMDWQRSVYDLIEMDKAVGRAKEFQKNNPDTLIVVVADHSHSMSVYGTYGEEDGKKGAEGVGPYEKSKFPTFVDSDGDGFPDKPNPSRTLAIGWGNHPEYIDVPGAFYQEPTSPTIEDPNNKGKFIANTKRGEGAKIASNLPPEEGVEVHSADDIPVMASGPGAEMVNGLLDNTDVFFVMASALGIDPTASNGRAVAQAVTGGSFGDPSNPAAAQGGAPATGGKGGGTPSGAPASGIGGNSQDQNSAGWSVALWIFVALAGLTVAFGGGMLVARRTTRK